MQKQINISPRFVPVILLGVGLLFAAVGGAFVSSTLDFSKNAIVTTGTVLDVNINWSSSSNSASSSPTYQPLITYTDQDGVKRSGRSLLSSSSYNYAIGEKVEILYDTRNPSELRINSWFALWGFGVIFLTVGLSVMIGAAVFWWFMRRGEQSRQAVRRHG